MFELARETTKVVRHPSIPPTSARFLTGAGDMDTDPYVLVALGTGSIRHLLRSGAENRHPARSPTFSPLHGITTDTETNIRTFPVLDALASLAVADASGQVVAVGLQVSFTNPQIVLNVAENGPVKSEALEHLANLWQLLVLISNRYDSLRRAEPATSYSTPATDSSPSLSPSIPVNDDIEPWRIEMIQSAYRYSILKTLKRYDRWWSKLARFVTLFEGREVSNGSGLKQRFIDAVYGISESHPTPEKIRSNSHIPANEWKELIYAMDTTIPDVLAILGDQNQCEEWAKELQGLFPPAPAPTFPFY